MGSGLPRRWQVDRASPNGVLTAGLIDLVPLLCPWTASREDSTEPDVCLGNQQDPSQSGPQSWPSVESLGKTGHSVYLVLLLEISAFLLMSWFLEASKDSASFLSIFFRYLKELCFQCAFSSPSPPF